MIRSGGQSYRSENCPHISEVTVYVLEGNEPSEVVRGWESHELNLGWSAKEGWVGGEEAVIYKLERKSWAWQSNGQHAELQPPLPLGQTLLVERSTHFPEAWSQPWDPPHGGLAAAQSHMLQKSWKTVLRPSRSEYKGPTGHLWEAEFPPGSLWRGHTTGD